MESEPHETHGLPAELPGVELEEDYAAVAAVQETPGPTQAEVARAALQNANLPVTQPDDKIAGVDSRNYAHQAIRR